MTKWKIDDIDQTAEAVGQRNQLKSVREFLLDNDAHSDLLEAVEVAIEDIEQWISPDIEAALGYRVIRFRDA